MEIIDMPWYHKVSIRKAIFMCTFFFSLLVLIFSLIETNFIQNWNFTLVSKYMQLNTYDYSLAERYLDDLTTIQSLIYYNPNLAMVLSITLTFLILTVTNVYIIYQWKIKKPIAILNEASREISNNNLDVPIPIPSQDELGNLCLSFEKMKSGFKAANYELWKNVEERRRLNAAFAHDLRTPVTVIKGYNEILLDAWNQDNISKEDSISMLQKMNHEVERLNSYLHNLNSIKTLNDIRPTPEKIPFLDFSKELHSMGQIMWENNLILKTLSSPNYVYADKKIITEVFQNIMDNAIRYAHESIIVTLEIIDNFLYITVQDDGPGFTETSLTLATEPYFREENEEDNAHFGLGLYICNILCQKCNGKILISTPPTDGAIVTAQFQVISF